MAVGGLGALRVGSWNQSWGDEKDTLAGKGWRNLGCDDGKMEISFFLIIPAPLWFLLCCRLRGRATGGDAWGLTLLVACAVADLLT